MYGNTWSGHTCNAVTNGVPKQLFGGPKQLCSEYICVVRTAKEQTD